MKFADDTKLESSTSTAESWDSIQEKKWVTLKTNGGRLKFSGMKAEATHLGQTIAFATSWKENELRWKTFKSEKGPSKKLKTNLRHQHAVIKVFPAARDVLEPVGKAS